MHGNPILIGITLLTGQRKGILSSYDKGYVAFLLSERRKI
nr:MAG TPA: hypothetical protein [Caudoviricetes sp.]